MNHYKETASEDRLHSFDCLVTNMTTELHQASLQMGDRKIVVAIGGYTGLGKGTLARRLAESIGNSVVIGTDSFILDRATKRRLGLTGDEENAIDFDSLTEVLSNLRRNKPILVKPYAHSVGAFQEPVTVQPAKCIIIEGTASLYPRLLRFLDLSYFLYADAEARHEISRKVYITERGYTEEDFEKFWNIYSRNCDTFITPSMGSSKEIIQVMADRTYMSRLIKSCIE